MSPINERRSQCLVALGANRGDTEQAIQAAFDQFASASHTRLVRPSSLYRTAPVGGPPGQSDFINAAALLETQLTAADILAWLLEVEREMGRQRIQRWGPREIDLDLLLYEQETVKAAGLVVPHPRMTFRRFVLEPAAEAAPEMLHPEVGWTMQQLLNHLNDSPPMLSILGASARIWAKRLQECLGPKKVLIADSPETVDDALRAARQDAMVVTDFAPASPPRLTALLEASKEKSEDVIGPRLWLTGDESTIMADLAAAIEAMR